MQGTGLTGQAPAAAAPVPLQGYGTSCVWGNDLLTPEETSKHQQREQRLTSKGNFFPLKLSSLQDRFCFNYIFINNFLFCTYLFIFCPS